MLAPMAGYTHSPFRRLVKRLGAHWTWSELVSAEQVCRRGLESPLLRVTTEERPWVVQLFGSDPDRIYQAAVLIGKRLAPEGLNLNLGCPARKIVSRGAGAALLRDPDRLTACAQALVEASKETGIPASAKFRLGWDQDQMETLAERLLKAGIRILVLHARLACEGFSRPARWDRIRDLRLRFEGEAWVVGNGDLKTWEDIPRMFSETGCQAVMVGRAALKNPWIFKEYAQRQHLRTSLSERVSLVEELLSLMLELFPAPIATQKIKAFLPQIFKGLPHRKRFLPALLKAPDHVILTKELCRWREDYESLTGPADIDGAHPAFRLNPST